MSEIRIRKPSRDEILAGEVAAAIKKTEDDAKREHERRLEEAAGSKKSQPSNEPEPPADTDDLEDNGLSPDFNIEKFQKVVEHLNREMPVIAHEFYVRCQLAGFTSDQAMKLTVNYMQTLIY